MRRLLLSSSIALACLTSTNVLAQAQAPAAPSDAGAASDGASDAAIPSTADAPLSPSAPNAPSEPATVGEPVEPAEGVAPAGDEGGDSPYEGAGDPAQPNVLEPPNLTPLDVGRPGEGADPTAAADRLEQDAPPVPQKRGWTMPETVFHLHGYMRLRGTFLRDGALGHRPAYDRPLYPSPLDTNITNSNYDPFPFFTPDDSTARTTQGDDAPVQGGCGDSDNNGRGRCGKRGQVSGDLRFRLKPEIHLSDDVRVKAWIDVLDNVGMGTLGYGPYDGTELSRDSALRARRVWGEARNRDIGELRFGRMGADWGLGIVDNGGDRLGIDSDFSTEVDRIMGITNLAGFYIMAAYDWASEGKVLGRVQTPSGVPVDAAQKDDLDAFTFSVARKLDSDVQQSAVARGETVFNYGLYFIYRKQLLRPAVTVANVDTDVRYLRLDQQQFIPDVWLQLHWEGLRVELEAAMVAGSLEGACPGLSRGPVNGNVWAGGLESDTTTPGSNRDGECKFRQYGAALELEYRLFDERLGLHLMSGFASGDSQAYGLAATNNASLQKTRADGTISTFGFHPDYRIDLILWRTLMRRVAGAYYFKPGVSYDFIRDPYGQLAGARVDMIYSRASNPSQTWGDDGNLGLEIDLSLYYRSEDGPDALDGFYGLVQFGVLFPFSGLGYSFEDAPDSRNAMVLRGIAGIAF